ncbi:hypothetical protein PYR78_03045 [Acinetobacter johnsonii]|nr:hypothetical protein PYR78_03045 [Acinetobacter johnsonii]
MEVKEVRTHHIPAQTGVDPIDLFIVWYGEHKSQITIRCWDSAWTGYRGGHWTEKAENYLIECIDEGMTDHLVQLFSRTRSPREIKWLTQILGSIHKYLKELDKEETPNGC